MHFLITGTTSESQKLEEKHQNGSVRRLTLQAYIQPNFCLWRAKIGTAIKWYHPKPLEFQKIKRPDDDPLEKEVRVEFVIDLKQIFAGLGQLSSGIPEAKQKPDFQKKKSSTSQHQLHAFNRFSTDARPHKARGAGLDMEISETQEVEGLTII